MIKKIRICNFKSLVDVTVTLDPVTVLVGKSGTGKSNFVAALRFLRDCLAHRNPENVMHQLGGRTAIKPAASSESLPISIEVDFNLAGGGDAFKYVVVFLFPNPGIVRTCVAEEILEVQNRTIFHQKEGKWIVKPAISPTPQPGLLALPSISGLREVAIAYLSLCGIGCYDFPGSVCVSSTPNNENTSLDDFGVNYLRAFTAIQTDLHLIERWNEIVETLKVISPSLASVEIKRPELNAVTLSHHIGEQLIALDLHRESEGFRRFMAYLIALYQTPPKQLLVFEEPEKGIHPGALEVLADQLKACPAEDRGQVILTTHSPQLLDYFAPEQVRVVDIKDHATTIGPMAREQSESIRESLMTPGELLTVDYARLATP